MNSAISFFLLLFIDTVLSDCCEGDSVLYTKWPDHCKTQYNDTFWESYYCKENEVSDYGTICLKCDATIGNGSIALILISVLLCLGVVKCHFCRSHDYSESFEEFVRLRTKKMDGHGK